MDINEQKPNVWYQYKINRKGYLEKTNTIYWVDDVDWSSGIIDMITRQIRQSN